MAQFLDLPKEVLERSILPFLPWNDLLRCRRVCKTIKKVTDGYIRLNPLKAPEIEVAEQGEKNLKAFIAMGIPTTKLSINNPSGYHFYDNLDTATLTEFTTTFAPMIRSLRQVTFSVHPCFNEWTFLEALTNLRTFEAEYYDLGVVRPGEQRRKLEFDNIMRARRDPRVGIQALTYPQSLDNLEVLKIGHNKQYCMSNNLTRLTVILTHFQKLEYISYLFCSDVEAGAAGTGSKWYQSFLEVLKKITGYFQAKNQVEGQKNLKYVDFINYHQEKKMKIEVINELYWQQSIHFLQFASNCYLLNVKLLNVNPAWYHQRSEFPGANLSITTGRPVVSLVNLNACVLSWDLPNLERITIYQTSRSNVGPGRNQRRPDWPALKILEINVNSKKAVETETPTQDTGLLFKFLLKDIVRGNLTELSLKFQEGKCKDVVAIPKTEDIVSGCPNLKKLTIGNWPGTNKQLSKLWSGLPGLEEVALKHCKDLGNEAFVGEDVNRPVFFQLKNLKKLTLMGLDQMPKITDTLFSLVLAKMKLSHLIISSDKPLEKITKVGITALLEGRFGETVEKFPFHGWSLATMSAEDFKGMEKQFRSYNML